VAELTNAQVALQAAVVTYSSVSGSHISDSQYTRRATEFLKWLNEKDVK
jgi:hypothetical protein